jgi:FkbH-like protein
MRLAVELDTFALRLAHCAVFASRQALDSVSPVAQRHDVRTELAAGFPYELGHADALAALMVRLLAPPPSRKGLITDLDNTLWHGILGDDGVDGVSWDLDHGSQMHGVYQQLLSALSRIGVLVGVASKNDAGLVERAFERGDMVIRQSELYPMEVNWGPKSESVSSILGAWNIGADSVVFVDDSSMELAEVKAAHPGIECILFPTGDVTAQYNLVRRLRDFFGKRQVNEEDRIRAAGIRAAEPLRRTLEDGPAGFERFLKQTNAVVSFSGVKEPLDPRILELINKTNQFNLNGRRYGEAEWRAYAGRDDTTILLVRYEDKYGPLGKISALAGRRSKTVFHVDTWVLSCRAFSRRIEHCCLKELFETPGLEEIVLDYTTTDRNGPMREFLAAISGMPPDGKVRLSRSLFEERGSTLYHRKGQGAWTTLKED